MNCMNVTRDEEVRAKLAQILNDNHGYLRSGDLPNHGLSKKHLASGETEIVSDKVESWCNVKRRMALVPSDDLG